MSSDDMTSTRSKRPTELRLSKIFVEGFTEEVELELIEFFKENTYLYDVAQAKFKRKDLKDRVLTEKCEELAAKNVNLKPCSPETLRRWLRSQRSAYRRAAGKKSGDGAKQLSLSDRWMLEKYSFFAQCTRNSDRRVSNVSYTFL